MSPKEKKSNKKVGKRGKKEKQTLDPNDLTHVDRTFYEITVIDLNNKLSRLRSQLISYEEKNCDLSAKLLAFEEGRDDITCHLQKVLIQRDELIAQHEETINNLKETYKRETTNASVKIHESETKYTEMKDQLLSEIKILKGQLYSLHEFWRLRDILYEKYDDMRAEDKNRDLEYKEQIFELQRQMLVETNSLRRDIENKLVQVAQDFRLSSEIRNASYTHRLIRENVALQKENEKLMETKTKIQQDFKRHLEKSKRINEDYSIMKDAQAQLLRSGQNKIVLIEKLTSNYEHLKEKYIEVLRYRKLYEDVIKNGQSESHITRDMNTKMRHSSQTIGSMKREIYHLQSILKQQENEMEKLASVIQQIRNAIEVVINDVKDDKSVEHSDIEERKIRRFNLLLHLMNIITRYSNTVPESHSQMTISRSDSSIYYKGTAGLVPAKVSSLMQIFNKEAYVKGTSKESKGFTFELLSSDSKIIPQERAKEAGSIVDVEWDSSLYAPSSHDDLEIQLKEDERDDIIDENESTSSYPSATYTEDKKLSKNTKAESTVVRSSEESTVGNVISGKYSSVISTTSQKTDVFQSYSEEEFSIELFY